jgi:hypothetical protein
MPRVKTFSPISSKTMLTTVKKLDAFELALSAAAREDFSGPLEPCAIRLREAETACSEKDCRGRQNGRRLVAAVARERARESA